MMSHEERVTVDVNPTYPTDHENDYVSDDLKGMYIHDIRKHKQLDKEVIAQLSRQVRAGIEATAQLDDLNLQLSAEQLRELDLLKREGKEARNKIVLANTGLVFRWVALQQGRGVEYLDLLQAANLGLIRAAEKFDPDNGVAFSTYATIWIKSFISEEIHQSGRAIRIPSYQSAQLQKMRRIKLEYQTISGNDMPLDEVAKAMNKTEAEIIDLEGMEIATTSLNDNVWSDDDTDELQDYVYDHSAPSVEDQIIETSDETEQDASAARLFKLLGLSAEEEAVIRLQFGFDYGGPLGQREIGKILNISEKSVRTISNTALKRLQLEANNPELSDAFDI